MSLSMPETKLTSTMTTSSSTTMLGAEQLLEEAKGKEEDIRRCFQQLQEQLGTWSKKEARWRRMMKVGEGARQPNLFREIDQRYRPSLLS